MTAARRVEKAPQKRATKARPGRKRLCRIASFLADRKAESLLALDISRMFIVDYFLLATCQSRRHLLSLARDLCEWQSAP
ncbi:MAG: RsfS/YbeB/iojap family protein, partial [Planctomycetes bacterium]|nr:RsfS/YbeB/iojap family protein [Planctomycetota bacterium]